MGDQVSPAPKKRDWSVLVKEAEAALVAADKALEDITGWSGGAGNWPAQSAHVQVTNALAALRAKPKDDEG